ncbi:shikimate kinase [Adhaeribacter radiodurans]|uniref:Shikimate kinase n=1 Tax=Adhaeribacter radiodurans TaxID=2745197 RepID=A0A7L7LAJ1_9BACT|nr:shikimate kinase [Adhaeribacter radiodurans]QMU29846.1 shikimate kinase [Adhaeribacter radiodurans]
MTESRIYLVGMPGSGKTTLGRQLATHLHLPFIDLDHYIERKEGKSVRKIFEKTGEWWFRKTEALALRQATEENDQAVIATGGGTPCFEGNMDFINRHGLSIYLQVPVIEILSRMKAEGIAVRPLLAGKTDAELHQFFSETLANRQQFYSKATLTYASLNPTVAELFQLVDNWRLKKV